MRRFATNAKVYGWSIKQTTRNAFSAVLYRIALHAQMGPNVPNAIQATTSTTITANPAVSPAQVALLRPIAQPAPQPPTSTSTPTTDALLASSTS